MAPAVINRLPIVSNLLKWFKGDELVIDNPLFKLHHQASTFVIMFGLLFIFLEKISTGEPSFARAETSMQGLTAGFTAQPM